MTSREPKTEPFFIGWASPVAPELVRLLAIVAVSFLLGISGGAVLLARSFTDPGQSLFGAGRLPRAPVDATLTGTVTRWPHPVLWLSESDGRTPGQGVLLAAEGKYGLQIGDDLDGKVVTVTGTRVARGDLDMVIVSEGPKPLGGAPVSAPKSEALGVWRLGGEICDGKCATGVMSPGTGLAHKACANLCILGELPAVLVMPEPLLGQQVVVLAGVDGRPLGRDLLPFVAVPVQMEGHIERRGAMLFMRADLSWIRRL